MVRSNRRRRTVLWLVPAFLLLVAGSTVRASAITAPPPKDCDTPNASNGIGVLEQPQSINPVNQQPFLTKTLTDTVAGPGSTTYLFTLSTTRNTSNDMGNGTSYTATSLTDTSKSWISNQWANATVSANAGAQTGSVASNSNNSLTLSGTWSGGTPANGSPYVISFFSELLDCAWDVTTGGNATMANYATQQNTPTFASNGQFGPISLDVNNQDAICDRVELKGKDPQTGIPFTDYSNLVASPAGTSCTLPSAVTPDVPTPVLVVVAGAGVLGAYLLIRRRRSRGAEIS